MQRTMNDLENPIINQLRELANAARIMIFFLPILSIKAPVNKKQIRPPIISPEAEKFVLIIKYFFVWRDVYKPRSDSWYVSRDNSSVMVAINGPAHPKPL